MREITLNVNGTTHTVRIDEKWTLLHVLREVLHLTGTKYGCGTADCGACKVLVDGEALNACVYLAKKAEGRRVETIESLEGPNGALHPIQQAFIDAGAVQCGFCIPGMVMTTKALLAKNHHPTEGEIRAALGGNLCRCTGYVKIVQAIRLASQRLYGEIREGA